VETRIAFTPELQAKKTNQHYAGSCLMVAEDQVAKVFISRDQPARRISALGKYGLVNDPCLHFGNVRYLMAI